MFPRSILQTVAPRSAVRRTSVVLKGVIGDALKLCGELEILVKRDDGQWVPICFLITEPSPCILGLGGKKLLEMPSVTLTTELVKPSVGALTSSIKELIVQCSANVDEMKVTPASLNVDGEPVLLKRRILTFGQRDGVLAALTRMKKEGTITQVNSSVWATPIVVVTNSDGASIRICGDYRLTLDPRLRRCAVTTVEPEDVMRSSQGGRFFSKIDLANAYLHISLEPNSKKLTTINTLWGLYQ